MSVAIFEPLRLQDPNPMIREQARKNFAAIGPKGLPILLEAHKRWAAPLDCACGLGPTGVNKLCQWVAADNEMSRAALGALGAGKIPPDRMLAVIILSTLDSKQKLQFQALEYLPQAVMDLYYQNPAALKDLHKSLPKIVACLAHPEAYGATINALRELPPLATECLALVRKLPAKARKNPYQKAAIDRLIGVLEEIAAYPAPPAFKKSEACLDYLLELAVKKPAGDILLSWYEKAIRKYAPADWLTVLERKLIGDLPPDAFDRFIRLYASIAVRTQAKHATAFVVSLFKRQLGLDSLWWLIHASADVKAVSAWPTVKAYFGRHRGRLDDAILEFAKAIATPATEAFLIKVALSSNHDCNWEAIHYLGEICSKAAVPVLCKILSDPKIGRNKSDDCDRIQWAIESLTDIGDPAAVPPLVAEMTRPKWTCFRSLCLGALRRIAHPSAYPAVLEMARLLVKKGRFLDYGIFWLEGDYVDAFDFFVQIGFDQKPEVQALAVQLRATRWLELKPIEQAYFDRYYPASAAVSKQEDLNARLVEAIRNGR